MPAATATALEPHYLQNNCFDRYLEMEENETCGAFWVLHKCPLQDVGHFYI